MTGFLTIQEAADLLGLSTPRVYQLVVSRHDAIEGGEPMK